MLNVEAHISAPAGPCVFFCKTWKGEKVAMGSLVSDNKGAAPPNVGGSLAICVSHSDITSLNVVDVS